MVITYRRTGGMFALLLVDWRNFVHHLALRCMDGGEADGDAEPLCPNRRI